MNDTLIFTIQGIFTLLVIISGIIGKIGKSRDIGFYGAFFSSLLFSPLLGILFVIASKQNSKPTTLTTGNIVTIYLLILLPFIIELSIILLNN